MLKEVIFFLTNTDIYSPAMITLLVTVGMLVGFVNTLAGMATALSYALFMAMGMPINVANGTTRVGVLAQFAVSSVLFKKQGLLDSKLAIKVGIPIAIGSLIGAQFAALVNPSIMEVIMGLMLPVMAVLLIRNHKRKSTNDIHTVESSNNKLGVVKLSAFVLIGAYGGFTHAGVGILIIFGSFYLLGLDLLRSNGIKQFAVVMYTPIALAVFIWHGQINWPVAIIYAIGNVTGAALCTAILFGLSDYPGAAAVIDDRPDHVTDAIGIAQRPKGHAANGLCFCRRCDDFCGAVLVYQPTGE